MRHAVVTGATTAVAILGLACTDGAPAPPQQPASPERREARYIEPVPWHKEHFTKVIGLGYPELGVEMDVAHAEMRTIDGRDCVVGNMISFDVDDDYAYDIDESVDLISPTEPHLTKEGLISFLRRLFCWCDVRSLRPRTCFA